MHPADESVQVNRGLWTRTNAAYTDARARALWQEPAFSWGEWDAPESQVRALPERVTGLDVVELGCGTAYISAWLARLGARPVGVDPTPAQLATARRCQAEFGIVFPLVEAAAEQVPLPDATFDLAISEYGRPSGLTRPAGSLRRRACCAPAVTWSSCAMRGPRHVPAPVVRSPGRVYCRADVLLR